MLFLRTGLTVSIAITIGFCQATAVVAEPTVNVQYRYYSIYPRTKWDLNRELDQRSPIIYQGRKFRGFTNWQVQWNYQWWQTAQSCKITSVNVRLDVIYTLPRIPDNHNADAEARRVFNGYFAALMRHEQNHKTSGLLAARAIEKALQDLPAFPTCAQLESTANQVGNQLVERYRQRDRDYDRATDHGRKEGVSIENFF